MASYVRTPRVPGGDGSWRSVQVVWSRKGGKYQMTHIGVAHNDKEMAFLLATAKTLMANAPGQGEFDFDALESGTSAVTSVKSKSKIMARTVASKMTVLWEALDYGYQVLGLASAAEDTVFRDLVLARIIEPTSKVDSIRVCEEAGYPTMSYSTIMRRLQVFSAEGFRELIAEACARHVGVGPKTLVLYDVTTLYWETDKADDLRKPGYSKERRLEPQITVGLLTDATGFPLMVSAFEGNKAETATMMPTIRSFMAAHQLNDVIVVADAGMVSEANRKALEAEKLSFVLGDKLPRLPSQIDEWKRDNPGKEIPDGLILKGVKTLDPATKQPAQLVYYQYRYARARRTLRGIDEQVAKAKRVVNGDQPLKKNKYVAVAGGQRGFNEALVAKHRELAGWKAYVTNVTDAKPEFIISAYHRLFEIEKSFRMSKSDLAARPCYVRTRESIDAHLTIVFAALAVSRWLQTRTGWSIEKFVKTARRYRTTYIDIGGQIIPSEENLPEELQLALIEIYRQE